MNTQLDQINRLPPEDAVAEFSKCCGSISWARTMTQARPFANIDQLIRRSDEVWRSLGRSDWLEAFRAHPKIGEKRAAAEQSEQSRQWSAREQSGIVADATIQRRLGDGNRFYEERFGFIFIVCATGKSAAEILEILEGRLANDRGTELHIAAEEQRRITNLRLRKLLEGTT